MNPLRQQMHDAMLVRGLAERTRQTYIENVARLAIFYHQNPADLTPEQVEGPGYCIWSATASCPTAPLIRLPQPAAFSMAPS